MRKTRHATRPLVILICGGSCSGKSVISTLFSHACVVPMDHFYVAKRKVKREKDGTVNYDAPTAIDIAECARAVKTLLSATSTRIPRYDMKVSDRTGTQLLRRKTTDRFIIVEGIFAFNEPLRSLGDFKIFIDAPTELRVARRMLRDEAKGRSDIETLEWSITVEKNHRKYVEPMKKYADLVIPFSYNPVSFSR